MDIWSAGVLVLIFLGEYPPLRSQNEPHACEQIASGICKFDELCLRSHIRNVRGTRVVNVVGLNPLLVLMLLVRSSMPLLAPLRALSSVFWLEFAVSQRLLRGGYCCNQVKQTLSMFQS